MANLQSMIKRDIQKQQTTKEIQLSGGLLYRYTPGTDKAPERILIYRVAPQVVSMSEVNTVINQTKSALEDLYGGQWLVKRSARQTGKAKKRTVTGYTITWQLETNAADQLNLIGGQNGGQQEQTS